MFTSEPLTMKIAENQIAPPLAGNFDESNAVHYKLKFSVFALDTIEKIISVILFSVSKEKK